MLLRLIAIAVQAALSIITAESKHGPKSGPAKKREVLATLERQAINLGIAKDPTSCDFAAFLQILDDLVDDVVALLNCFGLLGGKK